VCNGHAIQDVDRCRAGGVLEKTGFGIFSDRENFSGFSRALFLKKNFPICCKKFYVPNSTQKIIKLMKIF
jgi:hypothetical protein